MTGINDRAFHYIMSSIIPSTSYNIVPNIRANRFWKFREILETFYPCPLWTASGSNQHSSNMDWSITYQHMSEAKDVMYPTSTCFQFWALFRRMMLQTSRSKVSHSCHHGLAWPCRITFYVPLHWWTCNVHLPLNALVSFMILPTTMN